MYQATLDCLKTKLSIYDLMHIAALTSRRDLNSNPKSVFLPGLTVRDRARRLDIQKEFEIEPIRLLNSLLKVQAAMF